MQSKFFFGVDQHHANVCSFGIWSRKNRIKQHWMVIKESCLINVDIAVTMTNEVYQTDDIIPLKCSLEADQKKFKRDEVL